MNKQASIGVKFELRTAFNEKRRLMMTKQLIVFIFCLSILLGVFLTPVFATGTKWTEDTLTWNTATVDLTEELDLWGRSSSEAVGFKLSDDDFHALRQQIPIRNQYPSPPPAPQDYWKAFAPDELSQVVTCGYDEHTRQRQHCNSYVNLP